MDHFVFYWSPYCYILVLLLLNTIKINEKNYDKRNWNFRKSNMNSLLQGFLLDSLLKRTKSNLFLQLSIHLLLMQKPFTEWRLVQPRVADYWSSWGTCWVCSYKDNVSLDDFYDRTTARGMILSHIKAIRAIPLFWLKFTNRTVQMSELKPL